MHGVVLQIKQIVLPMDDCKDKLIWEAMLDGTFSVSSAYDYFCHKHASYVPSKRPWGPHIQPKHSTLAWCIYKNKVPTDNCLKKCGIFMVSCCVLCDVYCYEEDVLYVFFQCSYAWKIWNWLAYTFKVAFPQLGSTMEYFKFIFSQNISSQFYNLQVAMFMYILGQIWFNRNRTCFDGKNDPTIRIIAACKAYLVRIAKFCPRYARFRNKKNTLVDLGVGIKYCRALCVQIVSWIPPPRYWIKVNTDGMLKGSLHVFACGAMFKNFEGKVLGGFSCSVQVETVFVVELLSWLLSMLLFEVGLCLDRM